MKTTLAYPMELVDWIDRFLIPFTKKSIKLECYKVAEYPAMYNGVLRAYRRSIIDKDTSLEVELLAQVDKELAINGVSEFLGDE